MNRSIESREVFQNKTMEQLIVHEKDGLLELNGFRLRSGDHLEIRLLGIFVPGIVAHDQRGWYLLTSNQAGIRLQTGLHARLLSLSLQS